MPKFRRVRNTIAQTLVRIASKSGIGLLAAKPRSQSGVSGQREAMHSIYYSATWTECGCLLCCSHEHQTVEEAAACIPCAGGYVVGVDNGAMRSLTTEEESQFHRVNSGHCNSRTVVETAPLAPATSDSGYAVMTRIRAGDRWTWTTWMRFATHAEAAVHARQGNKVVRFRSPEWEALRQHSEPASPIVRNVPQESLPPQGEGETLLEFVLRLLRRHGFV